MLNLELDVQQIDPTFAVVSADISPFARISGHHTPAGQVLADVWKNGRLPLYSRSSSSQERIISTGNTEALGNENDKCERSHEDYTLIDPWLQLDSTPEKLIHQSTELFAHNNLGYAGLTPSQRRNFVIWLTELSQPAPPLYQQLYIAYLEVWLLEGGNRTLRAYEELTRLHTISAWRKQDLLSQAIMFGQWLRQEGQTIAEWIINYSVPVQSLGILLGWQAMLGQPLLTEVLNYTLVAWQLAPEPQDEKVVALHLDSLQESLKGDVLAYALAQLPDETKAPKPWRCAHRDLRIALPQPDVRPILEPLLREIFGEYGEKMVSHSPKRGAEADDHLAQENPLVDDMVWHLILEFSDNRTAIFPEVLRTAKRMKTFTQIMDENRMMIYRVTYHQRDLAKFWRIWWQIYRWSSVQVYINGERVHKDFVYRTSSLFPN